MFLMLRTGGARKIDDQTARYIFLIMLFVFLGQTVRTLQAENYSGSFWVRAFDVMCFKNLRQSKQTEHLRG